MENINKPVNRSIPSNLPKPTANTENKALTEAAKAVKDGELGNKSENPGCAY